MSLNVQTGKKERINLNVSGIIVDAGSDSMHSGIIDLTSAKVVEKAINEESASKAKEVQSSFKQSINNENSNNKMSENNIKRDNTIKLKSGQKMNLDLKSDRLVLGLIYEFKSRKFDVDTSLFLSSNGKTLEENFIFYNNKVSKDGSINLGSDFSKGFNYSEVIAVDLSKVDASIDRISITSTIEDGSFSELLGSNIYVIDAEIDEELMYFNFDEDLTMQNAIVILEIYRHSGKWKLQAIGKGFNGGLEALCNNYGIETE